jgi:hypothetical protein
VAPPDGIADGDQVRVAAPKGKLPPRFRKRQDVKG